MDIYPTLIFILFFSAVFSERELIGNYSFNSILVYYLITLSLNVLVVSHPEWGIAENINQGFLSSFLLKPMNFLKFCIANELAYKGNRSIFLIPFITAIIIFVPSVSQHMSLDLLQGLTLLVMISLAFVTYFFIKTLIGFAAFWFTEVVWLLGVWESISLLFSGLTIPIDLMPPFFQKIATVLPIKYAIFMPAQIILGKVSLKEQFIGILIQMAWLTFLIFLTRKIWRKGVRIYSAYGG